ncbi:uncharacterized protein LOC143261514 [Megalopta genalis]|uniref:uncharacterized protein LOC143261514 n=1 Tax=Megalopta genalis TaxID=115081 RepID=UPI003FD0064E
MTLEDFDESEREREEVTDAYDDVTASALILQRSFDSQSRENNSARNSPVSTASTYAVPVNLPKIDLPKFDGKMENWLTFKDAFSSLIDQQSGLNNVQKLNYLRLSLTGKAASAIQAFTICDDNYNEAWSHLKELYDNERALVLRHAALLRDTPAMPDDSSESIRDLANHVQLHVRSLQALGRSWEDIANDLLASILISKMSKETKKTWERTLADTQVPKIADVFKYLHNASHQCDDDDTAPPKSEPRTNAHPIRSRQIPSPRTKRRTFATNNTNYKIETANDSRSSPSDCATKRNCNICNAGAHPVFKCSKFLDAPIVDRIAMARKANVCLNCLNSSHKTNDCTAGKCRVCNKQHNTKLHLDDDKHQ